MTADERPPAADPRDVVEAVLDRELGRDPDTPAGHLALAVLAGLGDAGVTVVADGPPPEPRDPATRCSCDGAHLFTDAQNAVRFPFEVASGCVVHGRRPRPDETVEEGLARIRAHWDTTVTPTLGRHAAHAVDTRSALEAARQAVHEQRFNRGAGFPSFYGGMTTAERVLRDLLETWDAAKTAAEPSGRHGESSA